MSNRYQRAPALACFVLLWSCLGVSLAQEIPKAEEKQESANPAFVFDYFSVFENYIPFDEVPDISWRDANDAVGQFGGWRAYLKLVQEEARRKAEQEKQQSGDDK